MRKSLELTHNHNCLMGTITFKVYPITPASPRIHACNNFLKHFWSFCFWFFFAYFSFKYIMHGHIRERKEISNDIWHSNFAMPKHTNVIDTALLLCRSIQVSFYDWRATVVRWLLMPFSQYFLVIPVKKSDTSVKYKRQLNFITNKSHKAHYLSCA